MPTYSNRRLPVELRVEIQVIIIIQVISDKLINTNLPPRLL